MRFSLIIPAYNEERYLPRLLDSVDAARANYKGGRNAVEVIVADNASTDRTAEVAAARGCRVVRVENRVIAAARNGGARVATGDTLCFIDADSSIHPRTFDAIDDTLARRDVVGGATGVTLERVSPGIALTYAMIVPVVWLMGMDTGVVFCRREDFKAVGGYEEDYLYAEDVKFLLALRRRGRERGQHLVRLRTVKALGSTRKFDDFGDWHYITLGVRSIYKLIVGKHSNREFADNYWYKPRR